MKRIIAFLLTFVLAFSAMAFSAYASCDPASEVMPIISRTLPNVSRITVSNGTSTIVVIVATDYVGFRYSPTRDVVKVCQAYTKACGSNPGTIDGYWGQNSETALRGAQTTLYNFGYNSGANEITSDGECGPKTWRGFYGYNNGVPGSVITAVFG